MQKISLPNYFLTYLCISNGIHLNLTIHRHFFWLCSTPFWFFISLTSFSKHFLPTEVKKALLTLSSGWLYSLWWNIVLLAGMVLIFFPVAGVVLCFGFVHKNVLIAQGCFDSWWAGLTQHQSLFCFSAHPIIKKAGGTQRAGRGHSQDSWLWLTQCTFHTIWCHAQNMELGKEEGGAWSVWWSLFSQVIGIHDGSPCSPGDGWMSACPWELGNKFLILLWWYYAHPLFYLLSLSEPMNFWVYPNDCLPHPTETGWVSVQLCGGELSAGVKPQSIGS